MILPLELLIRQHWKLKKTINELNWALMHIQPMPDAKQILIIPGLLPILLVKL
jgi:hypothetical protein